MSTPKILILGAAGYIGGTVLSNLSALPPDVITALVRKKEQKVLLSALKINVVVGDLEDVELLSTLTKANDVVMNVSVPFGGGDTSIQAIVDGLEARAAEKPHFKPVLLQTSGTGSILHGSGGEPPTEEWTDESYTRWAALPGTAYFHSGDMIVAAAALRGTISAYIIMSPTVYGVGTGLGNQLSLQMPAYVKYAKRTGSAAYVGKGGNVWGNVHVKDLARLYLILMQRSLSSPNSTKATEASKGWSNLIYAGLGQHTWGPIINLLGDLLYARGEVKQPGAISIPDDKADGYMFGGSSVLRVSNKAKAFGWQQQEKTLESSLREALAI